jgi:hypothetical protein
MCGEPKTVTNVMNMAVHLQEVNMWCAVMKNIINPFLFEEHLVTAGKFLAMKEETDACHISSGTTFQLGVVPSNFSQQVHTLLYKSFLTTGR